MNHSILIKNGTILPLGGSNSVLTGHALLIEHGKVSKIAPEESFTGNYDRVIDAHGKLVMPGYINAHMHFYSTLVRGLGKAEPAHDFVGVLNNLWWRLDKALTLEDVYYSTATVLFDAIRAGTTTFIDHHASPHAVRGSLQIIADTIKQFGLRGCLCYELSDRDGPKITEEGMEENTDFIRQCQLEKDPQLKALFGLHASFTINEATLIHAAEAGKELETGFHIHVAEDAADQSVTHDKFGTTVVERLHRHGMLGKNTIAAHCIHLSDYELELLQTTDTMVVHNPQSNMNNAVGVMDLMEMTKRGILVGLGTDAMTVRMCDELRTALWLRHLRHKDPSVGFMEVVNTLYVNNPKIAERIWNLPLGKLVEGGPADVILVDYESPTPLDESTLIGHLVFGLASAPVDTTIVNGKLLMEKKQIVLPVSEAEIAAKSREATKKLWERF